MDTYLFSLGWWNFAGSILMIGFFYQPFGKKVLNDWAKIFNTEFALDYWGKFWLTWSIGLNIFFGLTNIYAAKLNYMEMGGSGLARHCRLHFSRGTSAGSN
jgi:hypothetical protein